MGHKEAARSVRRPHTHTSITSPGVGHACESISVCAQLQLKPTCSFSLRQSRQGPLLALTLVLVCLCCEICEPFLRKHCFRRSSLSLRSSRQMSAQIVPKASFNKAAVARSAKVLHIMAIFDQSDAQVLLEHQYLSSICSLR